MSLGLDQRRLYPLVGCSRAGASKRQGLKHPHRAKDWLPGPRTHLCAPCQGQASSRSLHAQPTCQFAALESCHPAASPSLPTHRAPVPPLCSSLDAGPPFPAAQPQPASPLGGLCVNEPVSCRATQPTNVTLWSPSRDPREICSSFSFTSYELLRLQCFPGGRGVW